MMTKKTKILIVLLTACVVMLSVACDKDPANETKTTLEPTVTNTQENVEETPKASATLKPTATPEPTIDVNAKAPDADFIDLVISGDGTISNGVKDSVVLTTRGSVSIIDSSELSRKVAKFPGGANYYRAELAEYYDRLEEGFSIETYVKFTSFPTSSYWGVIDNCEAGGFGSELHQGSGGKGLLKFLLHLDGAYEELETEVELDKWYHIVMAWDGSVMALYADGELVDRYDSEYAYLKFTQIIDAQYLAIGACCSAQNGGQGFQGEMALCRVYYKGLNISEVAKLNQLAKE